ncbi:MULTISPECIES: radical SAM protein [unclassified Breznakia]|uniref:SPL family radical SAM protein n=1 Tax=unclassified Breznakia TaxID=2623764 RepID=UPI0024742325|nr:MULTISPECIES: radical SAM protein [unclassified Breznakia]MDH6367927.1 DNA repair photolyase [Breznakia sp. PH1-1]MDH6405010.1 DNA repair photolyase [Breznakia sp. PF1-11]MDH6412730.1 DNA repair photolyase [Breznakia sp. PFB1-11]MDH6415085.1 DNA repair photolyase [Breznakia sp. PFB1-14]MDH6417401.1 DNA repair photolyase [Breznakia sp. PFB1-4]
MNMHKVKVKGILSARNGMNLYRGCSHGCIYCDSRSKCYHIDHDFEDIEVKENGIELLEQKLKSKRKKGMIGTGSMSDPYIPIEMHFQYVRKAMQLAYDYGFGFTMITKSNRVLRDLDLLQKLHQKTRAVVQMTLTTYDEAICKIVEPNVSTTKERVEALYTLRDAGIPTVVWLGPILPFINDSKKNLIGILDYCIKAKVKGIVCFEMGMTLREGNREYYYEKLDAYFPGMKERYIRTYGNNYEVRSPNHKELMQLFKQTCKAHGILYDLHEVFGFVNQFDVAPEVEQLSLF